MTVPERANILLVDDQPSRLLSYDAILSDLGQNLVPAASGTEALQRLMEQDFAVILLDINMPGMDGFETASLIHQHPRFERTPIIFVTGVHVTDLDRIKGYSLGAVDYVYIPVVPEILRSKVSVLVELYSQRRELERLNRQLERANEELARAHNSILMEKRQELERLNLHLERANADLERTNHALESEIAERRRIEDALKEGDRRKDEFLAILSHELRNPLAPLRNASQIMKRIGLSDPQLSRAHGVIERQVGHLSRLVDELLDVARITRGAIKLRAEPVDLTEIVLQAVESCRPSLDAQQIELHLHLPTRPAPVFGDTTRLSQVVSNLLGNAAKYTPSGGAVSLRLELPDFIDPPGEVVIRVRDSGVGIPPEMLPRVFDLFTQVERTLDRAQGGLGVGLALVRHLVQLHGGKVEAHSAGINLGSEFIVRLPRLSQQTAVASAGIAMPAARETASLRQSRRILVADDNVDSATSLSMLLRIENHEVQEAHDGIEAIELLAQFRPEVAFVDIGMPRLDGYGVARWLREQAWGRDVMLIALTGWGQEEDRQRTKAAGFNSHITKPVDPVALLEIIGALASGTMNESLMHLSAEERH